MIWGPYDKTRIEPLINGNEWYSVRWAFTFILYLQDQEDQGGQHHPENTTETKYQ